MKPPEIEAALFHQADCLLAEGPFWHGEQLWWVDIERGRLLSADLDGKLIRNISFGQCIGSAVPAEDGTFRVALEAEIARLEPRSETWEVLVRVDDLPSGGRFNDGKCDPRGRFIVGTMSPHGREPTGALYSFRNGRKFQRLRAQVSISNGLAWSEDGRTMYFVDTPHLCVFAYDYDLETGLISRERVVLRFAQDDGHPDGMTIDRAGRLWIAFWEGSSVRCYHPETSACEMIVRVPCTQASSCCFGGPDLDRLFITTASTGLSPGAKLQQPLAGSLFVCHLGTSGFPTSPFHPESET